MNWDRIRQASRLPVHHLLRVLLLLSLLTIVVVALLLVLILPGVLLLLLLMLLLRLVLITSPSVIGVYIKALLLLSAFLLDIELLILLLTLVGVVKSAISILASSLELLLLLAFKRGIGLISRLLVPAPAVEILASHIGLIRLISGAARSVTTLPELTFNVGLVKTWVLFGESAIDLVPEVS